MERKNNSSVLKSSKFSSKEKKYLLMGVLIETIFDKSFFKLKKDLQPYVRGIEVILEIPSYREYLYQSRTLLSARIIKDIFFNDKLIKDEEQRKKVIKLIISYHTQYLNVENSVIDDDKNRSTSTSLLNDMINLSQKINRKKNDK